ncbi:hypothetical protein [Lactococcus garvieae]|uniref:hypothetical protein n=1 Tax=Lactococcus garvieae TaxID=1363 RepID=UPI0021F8F970|nr:hypothetical protein [Lactococcus garvieae]UYT11744.1 hypothetical protein OF800_06915 [Lactococcus garvieae]
MVQSVWGQAKRGGNLPRAVLCCAVLCCAVLCCAVLCCAVLCCPNQKEENYFNSIN